MKKILFISAMVLSTFVFANNIPENKTGVNMQILDIQTSRGIRTPKTQNYYNVILDNDVSTIKQPGPVLTHRGTKFEYLNNDDSKLTFGPKVLKSRGTRII